MTKRISRLFSLALCSLLFSLPLWASDPLDDAKFRADDASIWHVRDNPALWALGGGSLDGSIFAFGERYAPVDSSGAVIGPSSSGLDSLGLVDMVVASPFINFAMTTRDSTILSSFASYFSPAPWFSFGMQTNQANSGATNSYTYDFGVVSRPADFLSLGATFDDVFESGRSLGLGLAFRPVALFSDKAAWLTLTADSRYDYSSGFVFESAGARLSLGSFVDLRGWWNFESARPGLELAVNLGPALFSGSAPRLGEPWGNVRAGLGLQMKLNEDIDLPFGRKILVLKDYDAVDDAPSAYGSFKFPWNKKSIDIESLCELVRRAAAEPSVVALVLEDFPSVGRAAAQQELGAALDLFKKSGKKLYVYADAIGESSQYETLLSKADKIAINPCGELFLTGSGGSTLFMKGLFDKLGIRFVNLAQWDTKSAYNSLTKDAMPEAERAMILRYLSELQAQADAALQTNRGPKLKAPVKELVDKGPYLVAADALAAGLVDSLEYRAEFEEELTKEFKGASLVSGLADPSSGSWGASPFAKKVALVYLAGDIVQGKDSSSGQVGQDAALCIKSLREDRSVAAILLRVDSGGGSALTSDVIANEVKKTVASGKPVVVSMGNLAASGGYYVSAYASRIFASPGTITGSIGVTGLWYDLSGLVSKLGLKSETVVTSPSAEFGDLTKPFRDSDGAALTAMIMSMYDRFVSVVAEGRKLDPAKVRELAEGQIWIGREALEKGLVDELGGLEDAKAYLEKKLGGRVQYSELFPGQASQMDGYSIRLASALYESVRANAKIAGADYAATLEAVVGPAAKEIDSLLDMGSGPLYLAPVNTLY